MLLSLAAMVMVLFGGFISHLTARMLDQFDELCSCVLHILVHEQHECQQKVRSRLVSEILCAKTT